MRIRRAPSFHMMPHTTESVLRGGRGRETVHAHSGGVDVHGVNLLIYPRIAIWTPISAMGQCGHGRWLHATDADYCLGRGGCRGRCCSCAQYGPIAELRGASIAMASPMIHLGAADPHDEGCGARVPDGVRILGWVCVCAAGYRMAILPRSLPTLIVWNVLVRVCASVSAPSWRQRGIGRTSPKRPPSWPAFCSAKTKTMICVLGSLNGLRSTSSLNSRIH